MNMYKQNNIYYFNSYQTADLPYNEWNKDVAKHCKMYKHLSENKCLSEEILLTLINDNYNFWFKIENDDCHFAPDCYLININLSYVNKYMLIYIKKDILDEYIKPTQEAHNSHNSDQQKEETSTQNTQQNNNTLYWYSYLYRPFSIGCQPKNHIAHNDNIGKHGIVAYNRPLTVRELNGYELKFYKVENKTIKRLEVI